MNDELQKVADAIRDPQNIGEMPDADSVGTVGIECGEMLRMWVKYKEQDGKREPKASFQSFGCETAIAVASLATEDQGQNRRRGDGAETGGAVRRAGPVAADENPLRRIGAGRITIRTITGGSGGWPSRTISRTGKPFPHPAGQPQRRAVAVRWRPEDQFPRRENWPPGQTFHNAPVHIELTGEVEPDAIHQCSGLERLTGGHDLLERHAGFDAKTFLRDDWPLIPVHAHEVRRDTGNFHAVLVRLPIRLRPRKTGQQRRMNVDDLVFEPPNEIGRRFS